MRVTHQLLIRRPQPTPARTAADTCVARTPSSAGRLRRTKKGCGCHERARMADRHIARRNPPKPAGGSQVYVRQPAAPVRGRRAAADQHRQARRQNR